MKKVRTPKNGAVTLQQVADHVGLSAGTVSAVLNDSPAAKAIPARTKERILAAAQELNYRPNFFARTLRSKRTFTVGVITEEIGDPYGGMVISGIEAALSARKYFFLAVVHRHNAELLKQYTGILLARGVEGFITVDTSLTEIPPLPTVAVAGHRPMKGVTNIALDHMHAARIVLKHLTELGHKRIAILRGQPFSSDSADRWQSICEAAGEFGIALHPELTVHLQADDSSPNLGYHATSELLDKGRKFTALFAYNDISAIGAIRAIRERGFGVPEDISVVGFDDIREAAYYLPSLTTVRQPLRKMGETAAHTLVDRLEGNLNYPGHIAIEPELVVRESTSRVARQEQHSKPTT
ncbi:MAG: LacI family transcriptional regulator [Acidobacteriaceae bacterium]|jgi:DNA-binding LacI/PurR family transcriptional regulator